MTWFLYGHQGKSKSTAVMVRPMAGTKPLFAEEKWEPTKKWSFLIILKMSFMTRLFGLMLKPMTAKGDLSRRPSSVNSAQLEINNLPLLESSRHSLGENAPCGQNHNH
jgi:hypothetical protein